MEVPKGLNQEEGKGKKAKKLPLPPLNLERKGHKRKANSELPSPSRKSVRLQQGEKRKLTEDVKGDGNITKKRKYTSWLYE